MAVMWRMHDLHFSALPSTTSFITKALASKFKSGPRPLSLAPCPCLLYPAHLLRPPQSRATLAALRSAPLDAARNIWALIWGAGRVCGRPQLYRVDRQADYPGPHIHSYLFLPSRQERFNFFTPVPSLSLDSALFLPANRFWERSSDCHAEHNIHSVSDSPIQSPLVLRSQQPHHKLLSLSDLQFPRASCLETKFLIT